jgi:nitroreductase
MAESILNQTPDFKYHEEAAQTDFEAFKLVVESRRTVRKFESELIPDQVVENILDLALLAPNSSNLQPWEFYWVRSAEKKAQLAEHCLGQSAAKSAATLIVCVARTQTWRRHCQQMVEVMKKVGEVPPLVLAYYQKLSPFIYSQGPFGIWGQIKRVLFFFIGFFKVVPRGPFGVGELETWAHKTTALACENIMLGFRAAGYDTCPMEGFDEVRVKKLLDLPRDARVTMVIGAGRRQMGGVYGPRIRFPREQFIFRV